MITSYVGKFVCCDNTRVEINLANMVVSNVDWSMDLIMPESVWIVMKIDINFAKNQFYNRKYYVRNHLFSIEGENNLQLIPDQFNKISDVFKLLDPIKFQRKRMIIIRFIIKKLFNMMHIDANIKITILRRTLKKYEEY